MHILRNISRSRGNPTRKFGQLIEYNMRNMFLEKSYTKFGEETSPRPFKDSGLYLSLDQQSKISYCLFLLYVQVEDYQNKTPYKTFSKTKKRSGTSLPPFFLHDF